MNNLAPEQKALISLVAHNLFATPLDISQGVDWDSVAREAKLQSVFSIAFLNYKDLPLTEEFAAKVKRYLMKLALSNAECFANHTYLHDLMVKNGISYCAVKGAVSAAYYPDPMLRSMGDVDFYVHPDDIGRAREIFRNEGFEFDSSNHPYHIGMAAGRKQLEMHFNPVAYSDGPVGDRIKEYWKDIRESAVLSEGTLATYYGASTFHHGFILLTHLQHHLFHEGVGLRHFLDWVLFANSLSNDEFLSVFEARLKEIGLFRLAQLLSLGAVRHFGSSYQPWMGDDYDTADELLSDILHGGNFGRKDKQRAYEGMFIGDRDSGEIKRSRPRQLISSLNRIVDYNWKGAKKFPLLYPIGWAFFSCRFLVRVALGKRKLDLLDTYQKSGERKQKYLKFRVFESENQ